MATRSEGLFATVVHTAAPEVRAESLWISVVHDAPAEVRAESLWTTVVHDAPAVVRAESLWLSVVHVLALGAGPGIQGEQVRETVVQGSGVINLDPSAVGN